MKCLILAISSVLMLVCLKAHAESSPYLQEVADRERLVSVTSGAESEFIRIVRKLCLSQVLEEDLNAKYIGEYLRECAAVYGVFDQESI